MCPAFRNHTVVQHEDDVGAADCRQPVRDGDRRLALEQASKALKHQLLRLRIERRRGLVEQENRRVSDDGARNGDALTLPTGQRIAAFTDLDVVPELVAAIRSRYDLTENGQSLTAAATSRPAA